MYKEGDMPGGSSPTQETKTGEGRDPVTGRLLPGHNIGKRHSKAVDQRAYIAALAEGFPPERLRELMETAIAIAIETKSWRGVVAASEFAANYTLGKPKQRIESTGAVSIGEMLAGLDTSAPLLPEDTPSDGE